MYCMQSFCRDHSAVTVNLTEYTLALVEVPTDWASLDFTVQRLEDCFDAAGKCSVQRLGSLWPECGCRPYIGEYSQTGVELISL